MGTKTKPNPDIRIVKQPDGKPLGVKLTPKLALEQVRAGGEVTWPLFCQFDLHGEWLNQPHHKLDPALLIQTNPRGETTFLGVPQFSVGGT